jgi:hypothetical protein
MFSLISLILAARKQEAIPTVAHVASEPVHAPFELPLAA